MVFQQTTDRPAPEFRDLPPVIWIGGGSGAGKSTVSRALAYRFDLAWYRIDAWGYAHRDRLIAKGKLHADAAAETHDQRWLTPSVENLVDRFVEGSVHGFPLILEDLRAMPTDIAVIVEGPQLFPELVAPYLPDPGWGLWLLPTPEFRRAALASRWNASRSTSDAERVQEKLLARNDLLDARVRSEATAHGLRVVEVDGARDLPTMIDHAADLLAHPLANAPRARTGRQRRALRRSENDTMITNVRAWLADIGPTGPPDPLLLPFACECDRLGCTAEVERTPADHEALRATDRHITAPDHAVPADEPRPAG
ncbi:hypothetical protein [Actinopolymorpha sp. B9G3]|uniref:hypothetical protein n=1 Tax=Actinopolymorpha sp. B9G3 TaxID=3158970 RepID=UPI0032D8E82E